MADAGWFTESYGAGLRPPPRYPFRTEEYEPESVAVKCGNVVIGPSSPRRPFETLTIDGREIDWNSVTLSCRIPEGWRLVLKVPIKR